MHEVKQCRHHVTIMNWLSAEYSVLLITISARNIYSQLRLLTSATFSPQRPKIEISKMAPNKSEKLPVAANFEVLQARIDIAIAKREAIVKSWVDKYDTSRCAPSKTKEEIEAWDAELFNPVPSNLGLGAALPKEFMNGDINRKDITGNGRLRSLMLGKKGLQASKPRDSEEKASSRKRGLKSESSDEEEGRSSLGKSKKAKREAAKPTRNTITTEPAKQSKPLSLQQKAAVSNKSPAGDLSEDEDSRTASRPSKVALKSRGTKQTQPEAVVPNAHISESLNSSNLNEPKLTAEEVPPATGLTKPAADTTILAPAASESTAKTLSEIEARREKNRLKKSKLKERKRKEKEQALAETGAMKDGPTEE